ncbi:hypothetical protein ABFX02_04G132300 [Erythranthe guttata]
MASVLSSPSLQDLKVRVEEPIILVSPNEKTERRSIFLSNIDQMHNYYVCTAHFFNGNADFPPAVVAERLKMGLEKVLVPYDFAAGRLKTNELDSTDRRLEIDCTAAGVGFVVASSEYSLHDLGDDFVFSNPGFHYLALDNLWPGDDEDRPLCIFQVTSFKCGGFAIGFVWNHVLFDGMGAGKFMANLATQAFVDEKPLKAIPCNDRHLLAARSPPVVAFKHPEFSKKPDNYDGGGGLVGDSLDSKIFKLNPSAVNYLKDKANNGTRTEGKITTYSVVAALIWRCKALSSNCMDRERVSTLLTSIDIRQRLNPPLPASYCGNAVLFAPASSKCKHLENWPFLELVKVVSDGIKGFKDEYARSMIDLLGINRGKVQPYIEYNVSSWMKLGFDEVVYPWGKPICFGPLRTVTETCFLFPGVVDGDVNALVSLPTVEMERFQAYFLDFFHP